MTQTTERQHINAEEVDDELLDRMFDTKRQERDMHWEVDECR